MMSFRARAAWWVSLGGLAGSLLGCAHNDAPTADPEAMDLDPPIVVIDEAESESEAEQVTAEQATAEAKQETIAKDPSTEVITFTGADAPPGMADEVTAAPKRDPLPSMMSDVIHGPNK